MSELSFHKKISVVRLYLEGLSYNEIANKVGVSKGSVVNVIDSLKQGQFPQVAGVSDQVDGLREVATELRKHDLSIAQAAAGLSAFRKLRSLEIDPHEVGKAIALYRELSSGDIDPQVLVRGAVSLRDLMESSGKTLAEAESWVNELRQDADTLEPMAEQAGDLRQDVKTLEARREDLATRVGELESIRSTLQETVAGLEKREQQLTTRTEKLVEKSDEAARKWATVDQPLKKLDELGMPFEALRGLLARIEVVADRLGFDSKGTADWFLAELEDLEKGLGLDADVQAGEEAVQDLDSQIAKLKRQKGKLRAEVEALEESKVRAEQSLRAMEERVISSVEETGETAREGIEKVSAELRSSIMGLFNQVIDVSELVDDHDARLDNSVRLRTLLALLDGRDGEVSPVHVQQTVFIVLTAVRGYVARHPELGPNFLMLASLDSLAGYVANWRA